MADVERLAVGANLIWVCRCGCSTYTLLGDGTVRCAECETRPQSYEGGWFDEVRDGGKSPAESPVTVTRHHGGNPGEFARRLALRRASAPDVVMICSVTADGRMGAWGDIETVEQYEWTLQRLEDIGELLRTCLPKDTEPDV